MKQKGFAPIIILVVVVALGVVLYFLRSYLNQIYGDSVFSSGFPADIMTRTPNPTANWKTYVNDLYKYSLKYPINWFVYDKGTFVSQTDIRDPKKIVIISPTQIQELTPGDASFSNSIVIQFGVGAIIRSAIDTKIYKLEDTQIAGVPALKETTISEPAMGKPMTNYYVTAGKQTFLISFENTDLNGTHDPIFDQILSTFKFTQ